MHPILIETNAFTIYSYGVCTALAVLLAWGLTASLARLSSTPVAVGADLLFVLFTAGIAGARLFYVLQHAPEYTGHWQAVFFLQEGGLVWYGGFLGAFFAGWLWMRLRGLSFFYWADFFSPIIPVSHALGRVGCFLNGCCLGKAGRPVQLYESTLLLVLALFLYARFFGKKKDGEVFAWYLTGYGLLRFVLEFFRADQSAWMGLTIPQWFSAASFLCGLLLLGYLFRPHAHDH